MDQLENQTTANPEVVENQTETKTCKCRLSCHTVVDLVLAIAIVVLFVLHFCGGKSNAVQQQQPFVPEEGGLKVAYVDSDSLLQKYEYAKDLQAKLVAYKESQEANYRAQMTQFQKDYNDFLQNGDKLSLSQQQAKEAELKKRMEKLSTLEGELAMKIQQRQLDENIKLIKSIFGFVKEYNESHQQYDIILRKSIDNGPTLYMRDAMDITGEIIDALNEEYKKLGKEEK